MNVSSNNIPSMKNVYDSTYWNKIKHDEQELSNDLYKKSRKPYETGIVSKNATSDTFKRNFYSEINNDDDIIGDYTYSLTGEKVNVSSLSHNNMTPFLKKNVTQNKHVTFGTLGSGLPIKNETCTKVMLSFFLHS